MADDFGFVPDKEDDFGFVEDASSNKGQEIPNEFAGSAPRYTEEQKAEFNRPLSAGEMALGGLEAAGTVLSGSISAPLGAVGALMKSGIDLTQGKITDPRAMADAFAEKFTYMPKTEAGSRALDAMAPAMDTLQAFGPTGYGASSLMSRHRLKQVEAGASPKVADLQAMREAEIPKVDISGQGGNVVTTNMTPMERMAAQLGVTPDAAFGFMENTSPVMDSVAAGLLDPNMTAQQRGAVNAVDSTVPRVRPEEAGAGPMLPEGQYTPDNRRQMSMLPELDQSIGLNKTMEVSPEGDVLSGREDPHASLARDAAATRMEAELNELTRPIEEARAAAEAAEAKALAAKSHAEKLAAIEEARSARQAEMEFQIKKQVTIDRMVKERQAQAAAPAVSDAHTALQNERLQNAEQQSIDLDTTEHVLPDTNEVIAPQYGAMQGVGRFDENGMPIRADLSMEANNLENPLQRNLWGDELGPALDQERSLTAAIDSMPPGPARDAALKRFQDAYSDQGSPISTAIASATSLDDLKAKFTQVLADAHKTGDKAEVARQTQAIENYVEAYKHTEANNKLAARMAQGNSTVGELLGLVVNDLPQGLKALTIRLQALVPDVVVEHRARPDDPDGAMGVFSPETNGITMHPNADNVSAYVLLHEAVHAASIYRLTEDPNLRVAAEVMMEDALARDPSITHEYGFSVFKNGALNIFEFVSEVMTNPVLQKRLAEMPESATGKLAVEGRNWLSKFIDMFRKAFGINPKDKNAFTQAFEFSTQVMGEQAARKSKDAFFNHYKIKEANPSQVAGITDAYNKAPATPMQNDLFTPRTPELIAEKEVKRRAVDTMPFKDRRLNDFSDVTTPEEATALLEENGYKDAAPSGIGMGFTPGANATAATHSNPAIRFMDTAFRNARRAADRFSREYLTAKATGISSVWKTMSRDEKNTVSQLLIEGDRSQKPITAAEMDSLMLSPKQKQYIETYYKANDAMFNRWNEVRGHMGLKPVEKREGHVPSVFSGSYKTVVTIPDGKPIVLSAESSWGMNKLIAETKKKYPGAKVGDVKRGGIGAGSYHSNDMFSGFNDIMQYLSSVDPEFAQVQAAAMEMSGRHSNNIFNFSVHEKNKIGARGAQGDKSWRSAAQNADDLHKALVTYFEQGSMHHEMQLPIMESNQLLTSLADKSMPKTTRYMASYLKSAEGRASGDIGNALNVIVDSPLKLLGFGSKSTLELAATTKNKLSQIFMGGFNYIFTIQQLLQQGQTGFPALVMAGDRLGNTARAPLSMTMGNTHFLGQTLAMMTGKDVPAPAHMKAAYKYALDNGLLDFSEMERAHEGTKTRVGRAYDNAMEFNMAVGEKASRTPMFMSFVDLLVDGGMPVEQALTTADNLTRYSMFDYHQMERPIMYQRMGVLGNFAGALTTYKHNYLSNQFKMVKGGEVKAVAASVAAMLALSGLQGLPGYDEMDSLYGYISDKFLGTRSSIASAVMSDYPAWVKHGGISAATGIALGDKFSSANLVPDSPSQALSPQLAGAGKIVGNAYDVATKQDKQSVANLVQSVTPQGPAKGYVERKLFTDEKGRLVDKYRDAGYPRSEAEWKLRDYTGLRSQAEADYTKREYNIRQAKKLDQERKMAITQDVERKFKNLGFNGLVANRLAKEYLNRGGDPKQMLSDSNFETWIKEQNIAPAERRAIDLERGGPGAVRQIEIEGNNQ